MALKKPLLQEYSFVEAQTECGVKGLLRQAKRSKQCLIYSSVRNFRQFRLQLVEIEQL